MTELHLIWNTDDCCDGFAVGSVEAGLCEIEDILLNWMAEFWETEHWSIGPETPENWDYMIYNCYCYLKPKVDGEYSEDDDDEIYLPEERENEIGWCEWKVMEVEFRSFIPTRE